MVDLSPARSDDEAAKRFVMRTPFAVYAIHGTAAPGAAFSVRQRNQRRPGFSNSGSQITLPGGSYRLQLHNSVWSAGTSNPETIAFDLFDDGLELASYSVQRPSADPNEAVLLSAPFLHVEDELELSGPLELRNGGGSTQRAALTLKLWQVPEAHPRPAPLAAYSRACGRVPPGRVYNPWGEEEERYEDKDGNINVRQVSTISISHIPYGFRPEPIPAVPGEYQVQVSGEVRNLSDSPATLVLDFYDGVAEGGSLVHTASIAAAGSATVAVAIDETLVLGSGWVEIRNGRADDLQRANLLLKRWWVG